MSKILVSGLLNIETTLKIDGFPLDYFPVTFSFGGINTSVSGVGFNIAKALRTLGDEVVLTALIGRDHESDWVMSDLAELGINTQHIVQNMEMLPRSAVLYDPQGKRQIHLDLKDIQETRYPAEQFTAALQENVDLAVMSTVNFNRYLLDAVKAAGIPIAIDVQAISSLDDEYNRDYMAAADILFISDENLNIRPLQWAHDVFNRYPAHIVGVGMGGKGAFLAVRSSEMRRLPAVQTRPIVSTIGAGDALFSAFLHYYLKLDDPFAALQRAITFASWKIGAIGASQGYLTDQEVESLLATT